MSEPRQGRPRRRLRLAAALVCLAAGLLPMWATAKTGGAAPAAPASAAASAAAAKTTLASIVEASAAQDAFEASVRQHLPGAARIDGVAAEVRAEEQAIAELNQPVDASKAEFSERLVVFDRITRLRGVESRLGASAHQVAQWADRLDADLDRVMRRDRELAGWLAIAEERQAPAALVERLQGLPARHEALLAEVREGRDRAVLLLEEIVALRNKLNARIDELEARSAVLAERLRAAHGAPLWRVDPGTHDDVRGSLAFLSSTLSEVGDHLRAHGGKLLLIGLVAMAAALLLIRAAQRRLAVEGADAPTRRTRALFERPWTAATALGLFAIVLFGPRAPLAFYNLYWVLLSIPAAILVQRVLETEAKLSLVTLVAVIASLAAVDPVIGPLAVAGRWLHILQYLVAAAALWIDLRRGRMLVGSALPPVVARRLNWLLIALLACAAMASAAGNVGLARLLGHGALGALGLWLVTLVGAHLIYGLALALVESPPAQRLRIVATRAAELRVLLRRLLVGLVGLTWVVGMMTLLGLTSDVVSSIESFLDSDLSIGEVTLSTGSIVAGFAVLAGTWLLVKAVRLVLDVELLPRMVRRRGVAFALSALVRYTMITAGVLLALAAMGIDLTKVTVIAGALGVGIGFGLQSVVNNFLSGLILLVERPVTAGDVVQIGDTQGVVVGIGVRSTTVRTPAGAEVIVPNADLITKVVSNWTLSDNRCRIEIEVNVPSAVDPDRAIPLLEAAAAEVDEVAERPAPRAWLAGLRDGQRSYRLHAWIADYDAQTAVQSALRVHIARRFAGEGVALP